MRIVMDLQSCQSGSRLGGIGRYSIELAKAMARQGGKHDFWIVLNSLLPHAIAETRHAFSDLIPQDRIRVFETPPGIAELTNNKAKVRAAELIREQYLNSLNPDMVHISSLFEGLQEDVITSVGNLFSGSRTAVTLYDLIPLIQRERYLGNNDALTHYLGKIENLKKAGLLLSISEFSREEAIDVLGISPSSIVNISSAADKRFQPIKIREELSKQLLGKYGISRKFLMYTGSFDQRKNHPNLIKAFGLIPVNIRKNYQLVIVGNGWDSLYKDLNDLGKKSGLNPDDLVFAGHVSDADLLPLYNLCHLFVFPSLAEGFGLPVLEAMSCGTPTICSDCTSLPEVIGWSEATFDPRDPESIARKISQALTHTGFTDSLRMRGLEQAKKFSWDESAKRAISAFESQIEALPKVDGKMLPGLRKIYAQASSESIEPTVLIEKIAELHEISILPDEALLEMAQSIASNQHQTESAIAIANGHTLNFKTGWVTTWNTKCGIASYSKFLTDHFPAEVIIFAPEADDLVHVDESNVIRCWQSGKPDNLHRLLKEVKRSKIEALVIQFNYSFFDFPSFGLFLQDVTSHGVRVFITFHSTFDPSSTKRLANLKEALALCDGLIVHSMGDVTTLRKLGLVNSIDYLPQGIIDTQPAVIDGLDFKNKKVIATYGFALPSKGLKEVVEAFSNLINEDGPHFHLLMVNSEYPDPISASLLQDIRTRLQELSIEEHTTLVSDYLPDEISLGYLQKADLIVYAYQATGESSSAAVRMGIAAKRPVAVTPSDIFKDVESAVFFLDGSNSVAIAKGIRSILELNATNDVTAVKVAESSKLWVLSHLYASLSKHLFWLIAKPKLMRMNYVLPMSFSMSPTSEKQCFLGSNSELKTSVGEKIGNIVQTTNRDGHILFGPYLSVASGEYQVVIYGDIRSGRVGTSSVDVAIRNGALVLAKGTLASANSHGVVSVLSFIIPEGGCTDLEVRIWVSNDTDMQISALEIEPVQFDGTHRFLGSDSQFGTQVGICVEREIVSTSQAGYLLFGPYIPLTTGQYQVVIRGGLGENGLAGARMDVAVNQGRLILAESALGEPDVDGCLVALPISLDAPCTDLEIRVWVSESTDLQVSMIEIAPWQGEQEAGNTDPEDIAGGDSPDQDAVLIEPAGQQQSAQVLAFTPTATEPTQNVAKLEAKVLLQELTDSSALGQPVFSMSFDKFAVIDDDSDAVPALLSAEVEMLSDHAQASNDASAPTVMAIPQAVQSKWKPSSAERNRAKADRKKKR